MIDTLSKQQRSALMSRVRGRHTKPEVLVRMLLHRRGVRFRLGGRNLPGRPDIVLVRHRVAIFVHGCFWHLHPNCKHARIPQQNRAYWKPKLEANRARDRVNRAALRAAGWKVVTVWECVAMKRPNRAVDDILRTIGIGIGTRAKTTYDFPISDRDALKVAEQRSRYLIAADDRKRGERGAKKKKRS
ncbi:MAG: very short patch repair endonuclease [bacterium]